MKTLLVALLTLGSFTSFADCLIKYDGKVFENDDKTGVYLDSSSIQSILESKGYKLVRSSELQKDQTFLTIKRKIQLPKKSSNSGVDVDDTLQVKAHNSGLGSNKVTFSHQCSVHDDNGDQWWVVRDCSQKLLALFESMPACEDLDL